MAGWRRIAARPAPSTAGIWSRVNGSAAVAPIRSSSPRTKPPVTMKPRASPGACRRTERSARATNAADIADQSNSEPSMPPHKAETRKGQAVSRVVVSATYAREKSPFTKAHTRTTVAAQAAAAPLANNRAAMVPAVSGRATAHATAPSRAAMAAHRNTLPTPATSIVESYRWSDAATGGLVPARGR